MTLPIIDADGEAPHCVWECFVCVGAGGVRNGRLRLVLDTGKAWEKFLKDSARPMQRPFVKSIRFRSTCPRCAIQRDDIMHIRVGNSILQSRCSSIRRGRPWQVVAHNESAHDSVLLFILSYPKKASFDAPCHDGNLSHVSLLSAA